LLYEKEKAEAQSTLADDDASEEVLEAALRKKLRARSKIVEKQNSLSACEATIEQLRKDLKELRDQVAEYETKLDAAPPAAKMTRLS